jgi:hypothetical protein
MGGSILECFTDLGVDTSNTSSSNHEFSENSSLGSVELACEEGTGLAAGV